MYCYVCENASVVWPFCPVKCVIVQTRAIIDRKLPGYRTLSGGLGVEAPSLQIECILLNEFCKGQKNHPEVTVIPAWQSPWMVREPKTGLDPVESSCGAVTWLLSSHSYVFVGQGTMCSPYYRSPEFQKLCSTGSSNTLQSDHVHTYMHIQCMHPGILATCIKEPWDRDALAQFLDCAVTLCNFEISTHFRDLQNAQCNFQIAQIYKLRGTYTCTCRSCVHYTCIIS